MNTKGEDDVFRSDNEISDNSRINSNHIADTISITSEDDTEYKFKEPEIHKEWYEDKTNFPALITHNYYGVESCYGYNKCDLDNGWRLATKEEIDNLYYKDKK